MSKDWLSNNQQINYEDFDEPASPAPDPTTVRVLDIYPDAYGGEYDSYLSRFRKGIRGFWLTRQTDDMEENHDLLIKTTLRELIIYVIFLVILMIITFGSTDSLSFYFTNVLNNLFLNAPFSSGTGSYASAASMADYWSFLTGPLMTGLYWNQWYNNLPLANSEINLIFYENKLVGVPRIRQLRVQNNSCIIADNFKNLIPSCYGSYSPGVESTDSFGLANSTAWVYSSEASLTGRASGGAIATYSGGGFYVDLNMTQSDSLTTITTLYNNLWIDRATRAVIIDFTIYNANVNLFCVIKLLTEFPTIGGLINNFEFRTVKLLRYVTPMDYVVLACELLFLVFILYYVIEESIEIRKHRMSYFNSFWSFLDIIVILISFVSIGMNVYRTITVQNTLQSLLTNTGQYPNFDYISSIQINFNYIVALTLFFSWIKLFKYIAFNKTMNQLGLTISRCAKDLIGFAVMFFLVFLAFAQLGYLLFSSTCVNFKGFPEAIFALFRLILGDFNFQEFQQANAIFGPLYFFLYVFFVFFILFNMFLAIIVDTYSDVKEELDEKEDEYKMGSYFKERANFIISKLNIKKEKIIDMQNAMGMADTDGDNKIDFDEWKTELRKRGYADEEIESVFAKYDTDGDRVLDSAERIKMQGELEDQKKKLNSEIKQTAVDTKKGGDAANTKGIIDGTVSMEEYNSLTSRVDRMETTITNIVGKIDGVMKNIEKFEKSKMKRGDPMEHILSTVTSNDNINDEEKRKKIESYAKEEIKKLKRESKITSPPKSSPKSDSDFFTNIN